MDEGRCTLNCIMAEKSRLGVSLTYGRDDIESWSGVCIILTSMIGQRSDETELTMTLMILFTACKGSNFI